MSVSRIQHWRCNNELTGNARFRARATRHRAHTAKRHCAHTTWLGHPRRMTWPGRRPGPRGPRGPSTIGCGGTKAILETGGLRWLHGGLAPPDQPEVRGAITHDDLGGHQLPALSCPAVQMVGDLCVISRPLLAEVLRSGCHASSVELRDGHMSRTGLNGRATFVPRSWWT